MKKVVIFNAPPSCGKDEVSKHLKQKYGVHHGEFKEQLFKLTKLIYDVSDDDWDAMYTTKLKEEPSDLLDGKSPRQALIFVSENVIKPNFDKMYFGRSAAKRLKGGVTVFSDGGFVEELIPVVNEADETFVIRIHRPGCSYAGDSRRYLTDHELTHGDSEVYDFTDIHNDGTLEEFFKAVEDQLKEWGILENGEQESSSG